MDSIQTDPNELAKERLFAGLYHELHRLAQRALRRDGRLLPISATTLLHESYLSVSKADFADSQRFLALKRKKFIIMYYKISSYSRISKEFYI
jgi:hypothetical protein